MRATLLLQYQAGASIYFVIAFRYNIATSFGKSPADKLKQKNKIDLTQKITHNLKSLADSENQPS